MAFNAFRSGRQETVRVDTTVPHRLSCPECKSQEIKRRLGGRGSDLFNGPDGCGLRAQLAIEPRLQLPRRYRRPLLRRLEQAHRSALENHVDRTPRMGPSVMISGTWYYIIARVNVEKLGRERGGHSKPFQIGRIGLLPTSRSGPSHRR